MMVGKSSPFGGHVRTETLLALCLLEESFARELARLFQKPLFGVQRALRSLEDDGLVAGRLRGRTRLMRLDPRYFAYKELRRYLERLTEGKGDLRVRVKRLRLRPSETGKRL
jgi:DNA-binding transcriptional ArsR family regulator